MNDRDAILKSLLLCVNICGEPVWLRTSDIKMIVRHQYDIIIATSTLRTNLFALVREGKAEHFGRSLWRCVLDEKEG